MAVVTGVGAGLVAAGGLALLLTLAAPERPPRVLFLSTAREAELFRRDRNARAGGRIGAVATVLGSMLLVVGADDASVISSAIGAASVVALASWLYLAREVRRDYVMLRSTMKTTLGGSPLKQAVYESQAIYVGMAGQYEPGRGMADMPLSNPQAALAKVEERTSWRWALTHPLGARGDGM